MGGYKSFGNCCFDVYPDECSKCICGSNWSKISCPICGGILSEIREYNGIKYRHCYACHMEVRNEEEQHD